MDDDINLTGIELDDVHVWPDTEAARAALSPEEIDEIRAHRQALLEDPEIQRYRAWVTKSLEERTLCGGHKV